MKIPNSVWNVEKKYNPCPNCKADMEDGAQICKVCGYELLPRCPRCGAEIPKHIKFCPECGESLIKTLS